MPELIHRLFGEDSGFLHIVAELWALELHPPRPKDMLPTLVNSLLNEPLFNEVVQSVPAYALSALMALRRKNGIMPWAIFTRQYGELRIMGAGKRERLKPHREPVSPCEMLWYRALIGKDFLDLDGTILECAYIPSEFLKWMPMPPPEPVLLPGEKSTPSDDALIRPADDHILDQTCTLLASLRLAQANAIADLASWYPSVKEILLLIRDLKLTDTLELPNADIAKPFLSSTRAEALHFLAQGWLKSTRYNDLRMVPWITPDNQVKNDPQSSRKAIMALLSHVPAGEWWSIDAFIKAVYSQTPDFLRPDGNYDKWLIHSSLTGEPLQGFVHWFNVEGALVRYLLTGPLHWLGFVDLVGVSPSNAPFAFRLSNWFEALSKGRVPDLGQEVGDPIVVTSAGTLSMTPLTPRYARYMVSRFCTWETPRLNTYAYRLTPASLKTARDQGLNITHLISLLRRYTKTDLPPSLVKALKRWDETGTEVEFEKVCVLRVARPEIMDALRKSPAARFLGEPLGPLTIIVPQDALDKVMAALARMGYLSDVIL
jgi:hypothetical protein